MIEANIASAGDTIEESIGRAGGYNSINGHALTILELESRVADTGDTVIVSIGWASGNLNTFSSDVLSTSYTNTSSKVRVVSLVLVTGSLEVGLDTVSVEVSSVSKIAFARNTVETLVGSTRSAGSVDPEKSRVAVALSVLKVAVQTTILVACTFSSNN